MGVIPPNVFPAVSCKACGFVPFALKPTVFYFHPSPAVGDTTSQQYVARRFTEASREKFTTSQIPLLPTVELICLLDSQGTVRQRFREELLVVTPEHYQKNSHLQIEKLAQDSLRN